MERPLVFTASNAFLPRSRKAVSNYRPLAKSAAYAEWTISTAAACSGSGYNRKPGKHRVIGASVSEFRVVDVCLESAQDVLVPAKIIGTRAWCRWDELIGGIVKERKRFCWYRCSRSPDLLLGERGFADRIERQRSFTVTVDHEQQPASVQAYSRATVPSCGQANDHGSNHS